MVARPLFEVDHTVPLFTEIVLPFVSVAWTVYWTVWPIATEAGPPTDSPLSETVPPATIRRFRGGGACAARSTATAAIHPRTAMMWVAFRQRLGRSVDLEQARDTVYIKLLSFRGQLDC